MGLDITAVKNAQLYQVIEDAEDYNEQVDEDWKRFEDYDYIYPNQYFPERLGSIKEGGLYSCEDSYHFWAGSYTNYSAWRSQICEMSIGMPHRQLTELEDEEIEKYEEAPFFPLLLFSDCEGYLGPEVCKILASDFEKFQEKANEVFDWWGLEKYNAWRKACEMAAQNGYIKFH